MLHYNQTYLLRGFEGGSKVTGIGYDGPSYVTYTRNRLIPVVVREKVVYLIEEPLLPQYYSI